MGSFPPGADCAVLTGRAAADEEEEGPWKEEESYQKEEVPWRAGTEACLGEIQEAEGVQWEEIEEGTSFLKKGAPTLEEKEKKKTHFVNVFWREDGPQKWLTFLLGLITGPPIPLGG